VFGVLFAPLTEFFQLQLFLYCFFISGREIIYSFAGGALHFDQFFLCHII
jgi:hypothetical protein